MRKWHAAVLVAVAVPAAFMAWQLHIALDLSRQKRTMMSMRTIAVAFEARAADMKSYNVGSMPRRRVGRDPLAFGSLQRIPLDDLERALVPSYVKTLPRLDGWGQPLEVRIGAYDAEGRAQSYAIRSRGKDARAERETYASGTFAPDDVRADILFGNGYFLRYPEGVL